MEYQVLAKDSKMFINPGGKRALQFAPLTFWFATYRITSLVFIHYFIANADLASWIDTYRQEIKEFGEKKPEAQDNDNKNASKIQAMADYYNETP